MQRQSVDGKWVWVWRCFDKSVNRTYLRWKILTQLVVNCGQFNEIFRHDVRHCIGHCGFRIATQEMNRQRAAQFEFQFLRSKKMIGVRNELFYQKLVSVKCEPWECVFPFRWPDAWCMYRLWCTRSQLFLVDRALHISTKWIGRQHQPIANFGVTSILPSVVVKMEKCVNFVGKIMVILSCGERSLRIFTWR